jgi:hypothetical protein
VTLPLTAALLGILIAGSILVLVRRGHLHGGQAAWWLVAAAAALLFGAFPGTVDRLGVLFGVAYPPMLLVVLAIVALLIKLLQADIELARKERRLRRLTQKMALLEYELDRARAEPGGRDEGIDGSESASSRSGPKPPRRARG